MFFVISILVQKIEVNILELETLQSWWISPKQFEPHSLTLNYSFSIPTAERRPASVPVTTMGQGKDYFDSMFGDLQKSRVIYPKLHPKSSPPVRLASTTHDYTTATSRYGFKLRP